MKKLVLLFFTVLLLCSFTSKDKATIKIDPTVENKSFLTEKLTSFFGFDVRSNKQSDYTISLMLNKELAKEGYQLVVKGKIIEITGADKNGLIYGMYELMQQVRFKGSLSLVTDNKEQPRMAFRAIKFNLPFMAYRTNASVTQHTLVCQDLKFWEKYLDMMAENRFNVLSLWSLHLFHYMVIPKNFPEATQFNEYEMGEWKNLWTSIFRMAKDRGIETYIVNWNTFVSPSFARAHQVAQYSSIPDHIGAGDTTKIVEQYTKEIITQVINEYPDLTGLGITIGERMGGQTADERRAWLDRTLFAGMKAADRKIKFIYRAPLSANEASGGSTSEENDLRSRQQIESLDIIGPAWVEFKFNWSHGHSSPNLFIVHGGTLSDKYRNPLPDKYKYVWMVRNEDFFVHRWGDPDFVKEMIKNNGEEYVGGYFIGSEVFTPAKDYVSREGAFRNWDFAWERQWLWYAVWGRLLYNPSTSDTIFASMLTEKYGKGLGADALTAWKQASRVPLMFASFHRGTNDPSLYTEGFCSFTRDKEVRFFDINGFCTAPVLDTIHYCNIADFVHLKGKLPRGQMSPLQVADSLETLSKISLLLVTKLKKQNRPSTVDCELADMEAWSWFARYTADKIRAGVALTKFRLNNEPTQKEALKLLENGVGHWEKYLKTTTKYNKDEFLFHTKDPFSWVKSIDFVKKDIELAKINK